MKFTLFDVETTGLMRNRSVPLEKQPHIVEVGVVTYDAVKRQIVDEYSQLIRPPIPMPEDVIKIHGITDEAVKDAPTFAEQWVAMQELFGPSVTHVVAHNAPFDTGLLQLEFDRAGLEVKLPHAICSVQEYQHVFGKRPKLTELYEHFTGKKYEHKHRAIDDTRILLESLLAAKFFDTFVGDVVAPGLQSGNLSVTPPAAQEQA